MRDRNLPLYISELQSKEPLVCTNYTPGYPLYIHTPSAKGRWQRTIRYGNRQRKKPKGIELFYAATGLQVDAREWTDAVFRYPSPKGYAGFTESTVLTHLGYHSPQEFVPKLAASSYSTAFLYTALAEQRESRVNLALMLAEYRQASDMVTLALRRLRELLTTRPKALRAILRLEILGNRQHSRLSKKFSDELLMFQYGVLPTMHDIYGIQQTLKNGVLSRPLLKLVPALGPKMNFQAKVPTPGTDTGFYKIESRARAKATVLVRFREEALTTEMSRVGLTNPALLLWERIPLSFVADWLFTIGDSLASLDNPLHFGTTFHAVVSYRQTWQMEVKFHNAAATCTVVEKQRGVVTELPSIQPFSYEPSLSARRLLSGLALTRQRMSDKYFQSKVLTPR